MIAWLLASPATARRGNRTFRRCHPSARRRRPYVLIQLYLFREKLRRFDIMNEAVKGFTG
jgi:hypothetical protein